MWKGKAITLSLIAEVHAPFPSSHLHCDGFCVGVVQTSLVRAIAHHASFALLTLDVSSVYSSWVGEGERILREAFIQARRNSPCILFIDEIDAMVTSRSFTSPHDSTSLESRILSTLLNEMDGIASATSTLVVGATNRLHAIDAALMRPGRFDQVIGVGLPGVRERREILEVMIGRMEVGVGVDVEEMARGSEGWSGADLAGMCREAGLLAMRDRGLTVERVEAEHFHHAMAASQPLHR